MNVNISELDQFADIMAHNDEQWVYRFKKWLQSTVRTYCNLNCLSLISLEDDPESYGMMKINELGEVLYSNYYSEIFRLIQHDPEKIQWWCEICEQYEEARKTHQEVTSKGIAYILLHIKEFMTSSNQLKKCDKAVSLVDITEVALARYLTEELGDEKTFVDYMK